MNKVVHCKREPFDVYIGRKNGSLPQSKWANPFIIGVHGNRSYVIREYEAYIRKNPELMNSLHELRGKTLGCWCSPNDCHGRILGELIEEMDKNANIQK